MLRHLFLLLIITNLHPVFNFPRIHYPYRTSKDLRTSIQLEATLKTYRTKKSHNILLLPTNLHVIPLQQNIYQNQVTIPNLDTGNLTHTTLIPIYSYIPLQYNHWVPVQDLTVIPLQKDSQNYEQNGQVRTSQMEEDEEINRFRRYFGGYGTGLYYGGHGVGHGFPITYHYYG